jgi:peptidoglycan hydrolase-like protein with peptidoglycan-binding domain
VNHRILRAAAPLSIAAFAVAAAGCSVQPQAGAPTLPPVQTPASVASQQQPQTLDAEQLSFDAKSASKTETINKAGGTFTLPAFGGFSGTLGYPSNNAPANSKISLQTSTTNIHHAPTPHKKTVLMFEQATLKSGASAITFNGGTASGTFSSSQIVTSHTYALYAYALGILAPGFPIQLGSPTSDGSLTFSSPLSGESLPTGIAVTFEFVQN